MMNIASVSIAVALAAGAAVFALKPDIGRYQLFGEVSHFVRADTVTGEFEYCELKFDQSPNYVVCHGGDPAIGAAERLRKRLEESREGGNQ